MDRTFYGFTGAIGHFGKYHNTLCLSPQILHKYCQFLFSIGTIVSPKRNWKQFQSSFSWDLQWSQEKTKTMLVRNLGGQPKSIMVFSEVVINPRGMLGEHKKKITQHPQMDLLRHKRHRKMWSINNNRPFSIY